jgi:hypothetical protein
MTFWEILWSAIGVAAGLGFIIACLPFLPPR